MLVPPATQNFQYDADGNLTNDSVWSYTVDAENRLIAVETLNTVPVEAKKKLTFEYDVHGRRIGKKVYDWVSGAWSLTSELRLIYDKWNLMAELNGQNQLVRTYLWGADVSGNAQGAGGIGGLLVANHYAPTSTNYYFFCYDGNGNVVALYNPVTGTISAQYEYGPFGEPIRVSGPAAEPNPIRWSTKYWDEETGQSVYPHRIYRPDLGRFLNYDPIGHAGGFNLYGFVGNDPVSNIDPFGLLPNSVIQSTYRFLDFGDSWYNIPVPKAPRGLPTSTIRKCNRKIENPGDDVIIGIANIRGHDYFDWPDANGGRDGVGFRNPNGKDGEFPESEKGSIPRSCSACYKTHLTLKYGIGANKIGFNASDGDIKDCLKNRPIIGDYHGLNNNCNDWARGAVNDCGLTCPVNMPTDNAK
jgi:RHS repeat-associated protein